MPTSVYDPDTDRKNPGAQHETDMLERMYHAPSATNSGSKQLARRELANKEKAGNPKDKGGWKSSFDSEKNGIDKSNKQAEGGWKPSGGSTSGDTVGKGYTGNGKKQTWLQRHKKGAAGWLISLILLGGGGSAVLGPVAGPFEFIHFANIVKDANFGDTENGGDSRAEALARYAFYPGKPQNVRLSLAGNYVADKIEARMNKTGFQSAYTERFGYLDGYFVDKSKFKGTQFKDAAKMSDEKLKAYFKATYDVDVTTRNGKLFVDGNKMGYRGNLKFLTTLQRSAGVGKTFSALQARIMGYRGGVTWHPIEKLQQKTGRAFEQAFKKREKARIQNGNNGNEVTTQNQGGDDENKTKNADDLKGATDDVIAEGKNASTSTEGMDTLKSSVGAKLAGGGLLAVGTLCILHSIAANVDNIEQTQVIMPLIRIAVETISLGQQIMFGKVDVDPNQLAEYKKYLHDPETGKDWNDSPAVKDAVGEDINGKDPTAPRIGEENLMAKLFGNIPGLDTVCGVINSAPGQVISITLGLLGGPISAVATAAFVALGPTVLDAISRYIAGEPINTEAQGATRGTYAMYGGRLAANDQMIAAGGQELSAEQEAVLNNMNENVNKAEFQSHSLAYRIFNPYDYRSLMGSFLDKQKPDAMANVASLAHGILNFGSTIVSMPQSIFTGQSSAKKTYDYGFLKYGYTADEFDDAATKNPYENGCYVVGCPDKKITGLLEGDEKDDYIDRVGKCFGINLGEDGSVSTMDKPPTYKQIRDNDCKDTSQDWLRIRFYIYDTQVVEGMACYFGDATACTNVKMGGGSAYNTLAPKWNLSTGAAA